MNLEPAHEESVEGGVEAKGDFVRHGNSAVRQAEDDPVDAQGVGVEMLGQLFSGLATVEEHGDPPSKTERKGTQEACQSANPEDDLAEDVALAEALVRCGRSGERVRREDRDLQPGRFDRAAEALKLPDAGFAVISLHENA